jgi:hypothetical protein
VCVPFKGKVNGDIRGEGAAVDVSGEPCIDMVPKAPAMLMRE